MFTILRFIVLVLLVKALESDRTQLLEDIGLWIPSEIANNEHDDKPEGELGDELGTSSVSRLPT